MKFKVRKGILPGDCKSLWYAVKLAKNQGPNIIPSNILLKGIDVTGDEVSESFAGFFDKKVVGIVDSTSVNPGVHIGRRKFHTDSLMSMASHKILECIKSLKVKNTEGYNIIPQRIIIDGQDSLIKPLTKLF